MKKFFLILMILFGLTSMVKSQDYSETIVYKSWVCENQGQWGSFYWKVDRTKYSSSDGHYAYYVYFYSNSFFDTKRVNGVYYDKAVAYIEQPTVTMNEYVVSVGRYNMVPIKLKYIVVDWLPEYKAYFYSQDANASFGVLYNAVYPYNYSDVR